ncbi:hypothetical protein, partial [Synechocystis sp. LEGE 06083]
ETGLGQGNGDGGGHKLLVQSVALDRTIANNYNVFIKARNKIMAAGVGIFIGYIAVFTGVALGLLYGLRFVKLI